MSGTTTDFSGVVGLSKAGLLVSTLEATGTVSGATGSTLGILLFLTARSPTQGDLFPLEMRTYRPQEL